jgi:hypothetical protein
VLVERRRQSATGSDQMARFMTVASAGSDEIIVERGRAAYIDRHEFRRPGVPAGVGSLARLDGKSAAAPGDANWLNPRPDADLRMRRQ